MKKRHTLRNLPLPRRGIPVPTKQQHRALRALMQHHARLGLRQRREAAQLAVRILPLQMAQLVQDLLDPRPHGLELCAGLGQPVPHNGLVHQRLPEGFALQAVLEGGGEADARLARDADGDGEPLVVEVGHDVAHTLALAADEVLDRDLDVVQLDEGRPARDLAGYLEPAHRDAGVALEGHDEEGETSRAGAAGADGHGGVVGPDAVGDPALISIAATRTSL